MSDAMTSRPHGRFDRITRWVGDLDHPFYDDERQRWVWYEASAIATQIMLVGSFAAGTVALLVGGPEALNTVLIMMVPIVVGTLVFAAHTTRSSAEYAPSLGDFGKGRGLVVAIVLIVFAGTAGWIGLSGSDSDEIGLAEVAGFATGVIVAVVGFGVAAYKLARKR